MINLPPGGVGRITLYREGRISADASVIVDNDDLLYLNEYRWYSPSSSKFLPWTDGLRFLNREVAAVAGGIQLRHVDGNKFDCRKINLEVRIGSVWKPLVELYGTPGIHMGAYNGETPPGVLPDFLVALPGPIQKRRIVKMETRIAAERFWQQVQKEG